MDDEQRMAREAAECARANNASAPPPGAYCAGTFDSWLCWPHTPAGSTARAPCPAFVPGFSSALSAHKECSADGTWFRHPETGRPWSNYTTCVAPEDDVSDIIAVYEAGYSVSLVALLLSLAILLYFRSLRCARITVHMNLFASFALNNCAWLAWYGLVVRAPATLAASPAWCRALHAAVQYAMLTTYTWMLCEGLYLHTVLVHAFVSERRLARGLLLLGWALPALAAGAHTTRRALSGDGMCWADEAAPRPELAVLAVGAVLLNLCFLCNIVRVLCTKLRAGGGAGTPRPSATALHALRATCLLAPLLGVQYLLMPFRPPREAAWWLAYEYAAALTTSLQGLCVAVLYCFCNGEVLAQLRRRWRVLTFRPRANSTTATTVSVSVSLSAPAVPPRCRLTPVCCSSCGRAAAREARTRCDWQRARGWRRGARRSAAAHPPRATSASNALTATTRRRRTPASSSAPPRPRPHPVTDDDDDDCSVQCLTVNFFRMKRVLLLSLFDKLMQPTSALDLLKVIFMIPTSILHFIGM